MDADQEDIPLSSPRPPSSDPPVAPPAPIEQNNNNEEPKADVPKLQTLLDSLKDAGDRVRRLMDPATVGSDWEMLENGVDERPELLCFQSRTNPRRYRVGGLLHASAQHIVARLKDHSAPDPPDGAPAVRAEILHSYSDNVEYVRFEVPLARGYASRVLYVAQHTTFVEDSHSYIFTMVSVDHPAATATVYAGASIRQLDGNAGSEVVLVFEYDFPDSPWIMEWWVRPYFFAAVPMVARVRQYTK